ncbi:MAG: tRNA pseudouridine(38-40) synthase TruA [Candidatus Wallbacteria bacterium]|nr:tRNA pseudouridine(38-40) synthase TruA [Candidatus Wallbacteria bacterium]
MDELNIALTISYDGSCFHGFQRQPKARTVQGCLEEALKPIVGHKLTIAGSGRTDTGVHALGQVVNFKTKSLQVPLEKIKLLLNHSLNGEITVRSVYTVPADFHSRYSVKRKVYLYWVKTGELEPWLRNYCWFWRKRSFDKTLVQRTAEIFLGEHDFAGFAANLEPRTNTVKRLYSLEVTENREGTIFTFEGDGFLRGMVRVLTSMLLHCGAGYIKPEALQLQLSHPGKVNLPEKAPPNGLYLAKVIYT